jgi:hypothetical protein
MESARREVPLAGPVREQPHFVLGPKSTCHERGPCGAKRGVRLRQGYGETPPKLEERRRAPFAATRERTRHLADAVRQSLATRFQSVLQRVAADGAAPPAAQAPLPSTLFLAPRTGGAVRGQDPSGTLLGVRVFALVLLVALSGCGYSLSGRGSFLPEHIKIIGVPQFGNNTPVFQIEQKITERVVAELLGRGRYEVKPDRQNVDAVLLGQILAVSLAPAAFNDQQQATRYALTIVANIEFRDLKTDKVLWSNPGLAFSEQYDVATTQTALDPNAFLGQNVNAMERLATEFARSIVSAILEAF